MGLVDGFKRAFNNEPELKIHTDMPAKNHVTADVRDADGRSCSVDVVQDEKGHKSIKYDGDSEMCRKAKEVLNEHYNLDK